MLVVWKVWVWSGLQLDSTLVCCFSEDLAEGLVYHDGRVRLSSVEHTLGDDLDCCL